MTSIRVPVPRSNRAFASATWLSSSWMSAFAIATDCCEQQSGIGPDHVGQHARDHVSQVVAALMERHRPDAVLLDANFTYGATNGAEGFRWLATMLEADPAAAIVKITAHSSVRIAVGAMKHGATDFVSKSWNNDRLLAAVRNATALGRSRRGNGLVARLPARRRCCC